MVGNRACLAEVRHDVGNGGECSCLGSEALWEGHCWVFPGCRRAPAALGGRLGQRRQGILWVEQRVAPVPVQGARHAKALADCMEGA